MVKIPAPNAAEDEEEDSCVPQRVMVKKMASLLVKPKVTYVSLVGHAANGLAFSIIKDEDGIATLIQPPTPMPKPANSIPTFGSAGASLNRLEFDLTLFKTEEEVRTYLTKSSISATRILRTDTHFVVPGINEASLENVEAVKGDAEGVTYWIGRLKAPLASIKPPSPALPVSTASPTAVAKAEGEQAKTRLRGDEDEAFDRVFKAEAAPELRTALSKMDSYIAKQLKLTDLEDVMETGEPSLPGFWEILRGVEVTVQNIISVSSPAEIGAKIQAAFTAGGKLAAGMAGVFISSETAEGVEKSEIARELARKQFSSPVVAAPAKVAEAAGVVKKAEPAPVVAATPDLAALVKMAVTEGNVALLAKVDGLTDTVEDVKKSVAESVTGLESRIVTIETVSQSRQSLPDDGGTPVIKSERDKQEEVRKAEKLKLQAAEKVKDDDFARRQAQSRLGVIA